MVIVVTGGIGSGKSQVCRILKESYGCDVYEADARAKELYVRYPELLSAIEKVLDCILKDEDGVFRPALLARRIFGDETAVSVVENLLFPYMVKDFKDFSENSRNIIIFESATVLEKRHFDGLYNKVILVDAPFEVRLERACCRDSASREQILARMQSQKMMNEVSEGKTCGKIDEIIINNGTVDDLKKAVKGAMERLMTA